MPDFRFAFHAGGPERVEIATSAGFDGAVLRLDGRELGRFADAAELRAGRSFTLGGGGVLHVQLRAPILLPELHIELDGHPLAGSAGHGPTRLRYGANLLLVLAALGAVASLLGGLGSWVGGLPSSGLGLLDAALLAACGWSALRGSRSALLAGIGLHVAGSIGAVVMLAPEVGPAISGAITFRVILCTLLVRAWLPGTSARGRPRIPPQQAAPEPDARPAVAPASAQALEIRRRQATASAQAERLVGASAMDQARRSLDHVALRCAASDAGLEVTGASGKPRSVPWSELRRVVVRMLPTDPPFGGQILLDLWPDKGAPVRLMPTTVTQGFAPCAATSRLERARAQAIEVLQCAGDAAADAATQAFLDGGKLARFATPNALHEYELGGPDALDA